MISALLNKYKEPLEKVMNRIVYGISTIGITPNMLTSISLVIALLGFLLVFRYKSGLILAAVILVSGLMDALDGSLARITNTSSKRGAFLDSFIDKVCEAIFIIAFLYFRVNTYSVVLLLASSYLVSYIRARAESLGVNIAGVGLMERAERLLFLAAVAVIMDFNSSIAELLLIVLLVLISITVIHRFIYTWRTLRVQDTANKS